MQLTDCPAAFKHAELMCTSMAETLTHDVSAMDGGSSLVVQEACELDLTRWLVVTGTAGLRSDLNRFMP